MTLLEIALAARANAHAPYSGFKVGAAIRCPDGSVFAGCNVENVAYPQGTCAEAGAISAMVAAGRTTIAEVLVVAEGPLTIAPCGGCRQKLAEFAADTTPVVLAGPEGERARTTVGALLPGAFGPMHLGPGLMLAQELIVRKRDGGRLSREEIGFIVEGVTSGRLSEGQVAAFAMAVFLRGLDTHERVALTTAMRDSGSVLAWDLPGPVVDKHSTGGIGDNVSLVLAPALAACGAFVPMISGRGLGHTGGTLDKFDAIPGYVTQPDLETFRRVVTRVGCAIIGQTADIAPADRRLYAIRDVTGTVESLDLITASILSKKLAAGLDGLVLDVKAGNGAFMAEPDAARALARTLVEVATGAGCRTRALVTDMNEPLASAAGNALEMANAARFLRGDAVDGRLFDVTVALGAEILDQAGLAESPEAGADALRRAFASGAAAERFDRMVAALGGPAGFLDDFDRHLRVAPKVAEVTAGREGFVVAIDTRALGLAVVELGGGRRHPTDAIDHSVGLEDLLGSGASVERDTPLARIHAADGVSHARAEARIRAAYVIGESAPEPPPLILDRIA